MIVGPPGFSKTSGLTPMVSSIIVTMLSYMTLKSISSGSRPKPKVINLSVAGLPITAGIFLILLAGT